MTIFIIKRKGEFGILQCSKGIVLTSRSIYAEKKSSNMHLFLHVLFGNFGIKIWIPLKSSNGRAYFSEFNCATGNIQQLKVMG